MNIPLWLKHQRERIHQAELLAKIAREVDGDEVFTRPSIATAAGDPHKLRGIPVVGARGVGGAINGTNPGAALE